MMLKERKSVDLACIQTFLAYTETLQMCPL